jgi:hypothetical protein
MNEVNIKYWFRNFPKNFFIDFLDELGLFIEEKPICTKKKIPSPAVCRLPSAVCRLPSAVCRLPSAVCRLPSAVCRLPSAACRLPRKVWLPTSTLSVQLRDFSFWISDWFGPQSILLIFGLREQIPSGSSHTYFWLLFHFLVKYWPILMFLGLIWCKILCWAQKSILYGV